ncbi:MAG: hypothetical protein GF387_00205 [Candidatus Portnoybacteria bacterium]|nr:hypothetical protein [Candidatus Portnoybacteria bacterium]
MKKEKILNQIKLFFKKYWKSWTLVAFLAIIVFVAFVFYSYGYIPLYSSDEVVVEELKINKGLYENIMEQYYFRQEILEEVFKKQYINPF